MKLIIDIPEEVYKRTIFYKEFHDLNDCVTTIKALEKAILLPKGHGKLIDAEWLGDYFWDNRSKLYTRKDLQIVIDNAPTIIEADEESEE